MKENTLIEQHDDKSIRCPRVGGYVNFMFCRSENNLLPCKWVVDCWKKRIDIKQFLDEHYSNEEIKGIFLPSKPKIQSLLELIAKVKKVQSK